MNRLNQILQRAMAVAIAISFAGAAAAGGYTIRAECCQPQYAEVQIHAEPIAAPAVAVQAATPLTYQARIPLLQRIKAARAHRKFLRQATTSIAVSQPRAAIPVAPVSCIGDGD